MAEVEIDEADEADEEDVVDVEDEEDEEDEGYFNVSKRHSSQNKCPHGVTTATPSCPAVPGLSKHTGHSSSSSVP